MTALRNGPPTDDQMTSLAEHAIADALERGLAIETAPFALAGAMFLAAEDCCVGEPGKLAAMSMALLRAAAHCAAIHGVAVDVVDQTGTDES